MPVSPVASQEVERILADYVVRELAPGVVPAQLVAHTALFESVLDSTNILDLANFIEEQFGIEIGDLEIAPSNFASLARLTAFILRKRAAAPCAHPLSRAA